MVRPMCEGLTPQEERVVRLIASEGLTDQEVAGRLYIQRVTVKNHLRSASRKAGVRNRVQLVLWAIRTGLVVVEREVR